VDHPHQEAIIRARVAFDQGDAEAVPVTSTGWILKRELS
jgi:hypothetical protein